MKKHIALALALLMAALPMVASATILVDTYSNPNWWNSFQGNNQGIGNYYNPASGNRNIVAPFTGNGERLGKVGFLTSFQNANAQPNNNPLPGQFTLRGAIFADFADFASDEWAENRPNGMFHEFSTSDLQPGWQNPVGMRGSYNLYYLQVDFSILGYTTQNGVAQGVSLVGDDQTGGNPGANTLGQLSVGGLSPQSPFWYASSLLNGGNATTFTALGFPAPDATVVISSVPEPGTIFGITFGVLALTRRFFRRTK